MAHDNETPPPADAGPVELGLGPATRAPTLVERLRLQWPDTPHHRDALHREAADEIVRAWAARDAAVADLEAHAEAEVRRAVAAERERWTAVVRPLCAALEAGRTHRIEYMNAMDVLEGPNK